MQDEQLAADLEALGAIEQRFAATEAERRMLDAVRARLPAGVESRVEGFVGHPAPLFVLGVHGVFMFGGGMVGLLDPRVGALVCLLVTVSLVGEGTGRLGMLRWWLPRSPSYNLVVPPPAAVSNEPVLGTLVLAAPLDVPRWRMWRPSWMTRPVLGVLVSGGVLASLLLLRALSEPLGRTLIGMYGVALGVTGVTSTFVFLSRREERHASSDASGPATLLALLRRLQADPLPGVRVWTVFTGCGHAHQDGMSAFLSLRGPRMDKPVLVVTMQDVGRAPLQAVVAEGPLWPQHHRPTGPALVERLRWAGVRIPEVDRPEPTDARAAMILGYRALGVAGGTGEPTVDGSQRSLEIIERLIRWYQEDLDRVADDRPIVAALRTTPPT